MSKDWMEYCELICVELYVRDRQRAEKEQQKKEALT